MSDPARYDGSRPEPPYPTPQADAMQRRDERELIADLLAALKAMVKPFAAMSDDVLASCPDTPQPIAILAARAVIAKAESTP